MGAIVSADYGRNYAALAKEPVIRRMARDLAFGAPPPFKVTHEGGGPTFEFMMAANGFYSAQREAGNATVEPESIGAVANAILLVVDEIAAALAAEEEQ